MAVQPPDISFKLQPQPSSQVEGDDLDIAVEAILVGAMYRDLLRQALGILHATREELSRERSRRLALLDEFSAYRKAVGR